jgi:MFS family permease
MLVLDITIVNVALPDIGHDFHSSLSDLQWIIDAYALVLAAGIALFTLGSLLCGLATDPVFLVAARIVQGLGGTVVYATSLALISLAFRGEDPKPRGTAFGVYGAVLGIGAALGPVVGAASASTAGQWPRQRKGRCRPGHWSFQQVVVTTPVRSVGRLPLFRKGK